jgi:TolB-like protein/Tfp pilus assembly protein PilF
LPLSGSVDKSGPVPQDDPGFGKFGQTMSFFEELKRRNVVRVAVLYVVASWLILQVTDVLTSLLPVPEWTGPLVFILLSIGLPLALVFSWAYELTPEGLRRERAIDRSESTTEFTGRRINLAILALLVMVVGVLIAERLFFPGINQSADGTDVTIAVLPFDNRSSNPEDAYFADGVHDELLIRLSRVSAWDVISRTSVEAIRNSNLSIPEIGEALGATHVIEGSVQRSANRIRLTIQLIDVVDDSHVWAPDPYDRELTAENLFAIQTDIAYALASSLKSVLPTDEHKYVARVGTASLEAYDKYLLARQLLRERTWDPVNRSLALFREAVDLDPDFSAAWAGLSDAIRFQAFNSGASGTDPWTRAEAAARRSLRLDPESSEAWASLAFSLEEQDDYDGAEEAYTRSVQLNGNDADARMWFGGFLGDTGRNDEALQHFEAALRLDPLHPTVRINFAQPMLNLGRMEEAKALLDEHMTRFPDQGLGHAIAASWAADIFGDFPRAIELAEKAFSIDSESTAAPLLASLYLDLDDAAESTHWLERLPADSPNRSKSAAAVVMAVTALKAGDFQTAYESAMTVYEIGHRWNIRKALKLLGDVDIRDGAYEQALERYDAIYPGLSDGSSQVTSKAQIGVASNVAVLLIKMERESDARALAEQVLAFSDGYDVRVSDIGLARARAHMVLGDQFNAKAELRNLVDLGWRSRWWYAFDLDPAFEPLHSDPEFAELRDYVASDMATMYQAIRRDNRVSPDQP